MSSCVEKSVKYFKYLCILNMIYSAKFEVEIFLVSSSLIAVQILLTARIEMLGQNTASELFVWHYKAIDRQSVRVCASVSVCVPV